MTDQIRPLTGVRFVAALWVVLYHFRFVLKACGMLPAVLNDLFSFGATGVQLFWILSGFVMTYTYLDRIGSRPTAGGAARFWWLRLARVWPVHVATMMLVALVSWLDHDPIRATATTTTGTVRNLLLVNDWPLWNSDASWNLVSWTVSLEWLAYLAFPVLVVAIFRIHRRLPTAALAVLAAIPIPAFVAWCAIRRPVGHPPWMFTTELGVNFLTGALLCLLYMRIGHRPLFVKRSMRWSLAFIPPALIATACLVLPHLASAANVGSREEVPYYLRSFITPLFALWVLALALQAGGRHGVLASRLMVLGGSISYSLYMIQFIWWRAFQHYYFGPSGPMVAAGFLVSLPLVSFLMWRLVEEPARNLMRLVSNVRLRMLIPAQASAAAS